MKLQQAGRQARAHLLTEEDWQAGKPAGRRAGRQAGRERERGVCRLPRAEGELLEL